MLKSSIANIYKACIDYMGDLTVAKTVFKILIVAKYSI